MLVFPLLRNFESDASDLIFARCSFIRPVSPMYTLLQSEQGIEYTTFFIVLDSSFPLSIRRKIRFRLKYFLNAKGIF